jgi:hypothetical protein
VDNVRLQPSAKAFPVHFDMQFRESKYCARKLSRYWTRTNRKTAKQITYLRDTTIFIVIAKNSALSEGPNSTPNKQKNPAAGIVPSFLGFASVLSAVGVGVGIGAYLDNAMVSAFVAHVLAGIVIAAISEIGKKLKSPAK